MKIWIQWKARQQRLYNVEINSETTGQTRKFIHEPGQRRPTRHPMTARQAGLSLGLEFIFLLYYLITLAFIAFIWSIIYWESTKRQSKTLVFHPLHALSSYKFSLAFLAQRNNENSSELLNTRFGAHFSLLSHEMTLKDGVRLFNQPDAFYYFSIQRMGSEESQCQTVNSHQLAPFAAAALRGGFRTAAEPPELEDQPCDNPSRLLLNSSFLRTAVTASHSLLQSPPEALRLVKPNYSQVSLSETDSEGRGFKSSSEEVQQQPPEQHTDAGPSVRRSSIECLINSQSSQESLEVDPCMMQPISDYILSEQNLFRPTTIAKQNFIRFRNEDVTLSYSIEDKLGEGGFGMVYRAVCRKSGVVRAAKILKRARLPQEELRKVENEVDLLRLLDHPNILKVYEAYLHEGHYSIITELCEGGSLSALLREGRIFTERAIRIVFRKLMGALAYLHELGIMHRDIKLDNILLVRRESGPGSSWDIRLIDFGLARQLSAQRMRDRAKVGTYTHLAPEVIRGVYSTKCDLWSAGIALCCLVTGGNPFKKSTKELTYESIMKTNFNLEGAIWKNVNQDLKNLVLRLLTKDLSQRISASGALTHPFLLGVKELGVEGEKDVLEQAIRKLSAYYHGNNLVSLIESYLSYTTLTPSDLHLFAALFQTLDLNGDGFIQRHELQAAFVKFGCPIAEGELQYVLSKVDKNKSGKIDYSQFVAALTDRSKLFTESSLASAFRYFDANKSGFLEKEELRAALKLVDGKELDFLLGEVDKNNDHRISEEEFVRYLSGEKKG